MRRLRSLVIGFALFIVAAFLFGGRFYEEYFIFGFSPAWRTTARTECHYLTVLDMVTPYCCLQTIKTYNDTGAIPYNGTSCPSGYVPTSWVPMCSGTDACYPAGAAPSLPPARPEFHVTDDFDTLGGVPYQ